MSKAPYFFSYASLLLERDDPVAAYLLLDHVFHGRLTEAEAFVRHEDTRKDLSHPYNEAFRVASRCATVEDAEAIWSRLDAWLGSVKTSVESDECQRGTKALIEFTRKAEHRWRQQQEQKRSKR